MRILKPRVRADAIDSAVTYLILAGCLSSAHVSEFYSYMACQEDEAIAQTLQRAMEAYLSHLFRVWNLN
jgi:hypothetical protein